MIRKITNITGVKRVYVYTLASFIFIPMLGHSLSLGRIVTNSVSGVPFDADIVMDDVASDVKPAQLKVKLASDQEYSDLGLQIEPYQKDLEFVPYKKNGNEWYIKVKSSTPLNKQFVNFLIAVDYPSGHTVREYMAILQNAQTNREVDATANQWFNSDYSLATTKDNKKIVRMVDNPTPDSAKPAVENQKPLITYKSTDNDDVADDEQYFKKQKLEADKIEAKPVNSTGEPVAKTQSPKIDSQVLEKHETVKIASQAVDNKTAANISADIKAPDIKEIAAAAPQKQTKITVTNIVVAEHGDSLWNIAKRYTDNAQDTTRMVDAIYSNNKHAFANQNIHMLKTRAKLHIPQLDNSTRVAGNTSGQISRNIPEQASPNPQEMDAAILDSNVISIYAADGDLSKLSVKAAVAKPRVKPAATKTTTTVQTVKTSPTKELLNITSLAEDLARSKKLITDNDKFVKQIPAEPQLADATKPAQQKLKILSAHDSATAPTTNKLMLVSEQLVSRQKENQDLKEQVLILQSQMKDMRKLLDLRKQQIAGNQTSLGNSSAHFTANGNNVASNKTVLDAFGNKVVSVSKINSKTAASTESQILFWLMFICAFGSLCLAFAYYYWRKHYKMQPMTRDFMSESQENTELKARDSKAYTDIVLDDILVKAQGRSTASDVSANFDLARAYIELDDYATAKKILDEILQYGDNEHKKEAHKILESLPA